MRLPGWGPGLPDRAPKPRQPCGSFQGGIALVAEFLAGGDAHPALGAKGVPLFRVQQETAAGAAITLAGFIRGLAMGALRHGGPPECRNQVEGWI